MPRRARLNVAGGVFHVVSRFARDERWLERAGARAAYLDAVGSAVERSDAEVLAYCLMSNHVHLVVVQGERSLERFTKSVHVTFSHWVRGQRGRSKAQGAVFAERPRMLLVDREEYLLELVRYVHNNPVRAGVVRFARSSDWSSHQAYIGRAEAPPWLRMGYVLSRFGTRGAAAKFDAFVDEGRKAPREPAFSGLVRRTEAQALGQGLGDGHRLSDGVLGSEKFVARVHADTERVQVAFSGRGAEKRSGPVGRPPLREVTNAVCELLDVDPVELDERPRSARSVAVKRLVTWVWVHEYQGQQIELARAFGMATGAVSRHYGHTIANAGDYDQQATAVVARLRKRIAKRPARRTAATAGAHRVRYHIDVDET